MIAQGEDGDGGSLGLRFEPGPVFANLVLADEINRASPKTQSSLLQAMQERAVTVRGRTYPLPRPFLVLATQNPLEMEGTYPTARGARSTASSSRSSSAIRDRKSSSASSSAPPAPPRRPRKA